MGLGMEGSMTMARDWTREDFSIAESDEDGSPRMSGPVKFSVQVVSANDGKVTLNLVRHYEDGSAESQLYRMVTGDAVALDTLEWLRASHQEIPE
jgi:hypothetical protein